MKITKLLFSSLIILAFAAFFVQLSLAEEIVRPDIYDLIESENIDAINAMIEGGLDPDEPSDNIMPPPLVYAISRVKQKSAKALLEAGASPDVRWKANMDHTALMLAVNKLRDQTDPSLASESLGITLLLLESGADPNAAVTNTAGADEVGLTPLHEAVLINDLQLAIKVCRLLIENGADVNAKSSQLSVTALQNAGLARGNREPLRRYLKSVGAK